MGINKFVSAILGNLPLTVYGDGNQTRDFTFISDVVEANLLAAKNPESNQVFNIGGGSRISVKDLIFTIETAANKTATTCHTESQKGDARDTLADNSNARKYLGWQPRVAIKEGIEKYVQWHTNRIN